MHGSVPTSPRAPRRPGLVRLATWCARRRRTVVAAWVVALVAVAALAATAGGEHRVDYAMPGSESRAVRDLLTERFPDRAGDVAVLVLHAPDGLDATGGPQRIEALTAEVVAIDHVTGVDAAATSPDGRTAIVPVQLDRPTEALPHHTGLAIIDAVAGATGAGIQVEAGGWPVELAESSESGSEGIGLVLALVILLAAFGSALAAGIPIVLALCGLGVGSGLAMLVARVLDVPEWGSMLATMLGIGVGIDYALFIVTRYRSALGEGESPEGAVATAAGTSGRAVLFAGGTVLVSLLGLGAMGLDYMWGAALAMSLAVLSVLAATMTLLPAVLGFAGASIDRLRVPGVRGATRSERWASWSRSVQRRPVVAATLGVLLLGVLAAPVTGIRYGFPDAGSGPEDLTSRRAFDLVADGFGPGANGPLLVTVDAPAGTAGEVAASVASAVVADPAVSAAFGGQVDDAGTTATVTVVPAAGPQTPATETLVRQLRGETLPALAERTDARFLVGGATALFIDEADHEGARLPWFIAAVLTASFVLLLMVFRAPLVALKATVLNLLGIGAAYGVIAHAAQGGWFGQLLGIDAATPIPVFVLILMFAILFGLSMDYEVFLLSRIREEHLAGRSNSEAVVEGVATTARVITAAAAIMVCVFGAFVLEDTVFIKLSGLGLAAAVLLDATVVRLVLVPATMELLGERNWWIPAWLERRLPHVELEARSPEPALVD
jgi:putative drug exporter of the RND superfamily